jgi:hypothetical protein
LKQTGIFGRYIYSDFKKNIQQNILTEYDLWKPSFVRTSNGAEIDLIIERPGHQHLLECKLSKAPRPSGEFYELIDSIAYNICGLSVSMFVVRRS